jgi:hypothetical protein
MAPERATVRLGATASAFPTSSAQVEIRRKLGEGTRRRSGSPNRGRSSGVRPAVRSTSTASATGDLRRVAPAPFGRARPSVPRARRRSHGLLARAGVLPRRCVRRRRARMGVIGDRGAGKCAMMAELGSGRRAGAERRPARRRGPNCVHRASGRRPARRRSLEARRRRKPRRPGRTRALAARASRRGVGRPAGRLALPRLG